MSSRMSEKPPTAAADRKLFGARINRLTAQLSTQLNSLGVPRRLWMLLGACVGLVLFARLVFSSSGGTDDRGHYWASGGLLTAYDFQSASAADPPPFDFCPVFGPDDIVAQRRGQVPLLRSRLHMGSGARVQRVIQKAMAGHPVTISVLGGSVSACHGAGDDPLAPKCWPARFFEWWNLQFPHQLNELTNGAARKTDSSYFAYCSSHHLPDETDLVLLDFDASDPNEPKWMDHFELLVRSILQRPEQPAVIIMGHFAPQLQQQLGYAGPELLHQIVAQFYDVPHLSAKGMLYNDYMLDPQGTRDMFYTDMVLANTRGHEVLSDMLISYMMQQICSGWATTLGHAFDVPYMGATDGADAAAEDKSKASSEDLEQQAGGLAAKQRAMRVPKGRLALRPTEIHLKFREPKPMCVIANNLINPLPPSHFFGSGWMSHHPAKGANEEESKYYWYAVKAGSRMRVPIKVNAGEVSVYYLQNPESKPLGRAACWVDDDYANRFELSGTGKEVPDTTPTLTIISKDVADGDHYVECVLLPENGGGKDVAPFKMLGV